MTTYLQSVYYNLLENVVRGPYTPAKQMDNDQVVEKPMSEWIEKVKVYIMNARAMNTLYCGLDSEEFCRYQLIKLIRIFCSLLRSHIRVPANIYY